MTEILPKCDCPSPRKGCIGTMEAGRRSFSNRDMRRDEMLESKADNDDVVRDEPPTDSEEGRTLRLILYDAIASEAMGTLTTGVFLAGFAVALDADNLAIGVLAAVPFLVQLLQIPATLLVERLRVRRDICVWAAGIGRAFLLAAAVAPLLPTTAGVVTLIVSLAIYQGMAAIGGCAWNSWMRDLVPASQFGRFFGRRTTATTAVSIVLALVGSALIDSWKSYVPDHAAAGYTILFTLSALIGFLGVYLLRITPDRPMAPWRRPPIRSRCFPHRCAIPTSGACCSSSRRGISR
jgi:hypothetical protein